MTKARRFTAISAAGVTGDVLLTEISFEALGDKPIGDVHQHLTLTNITFADTAGNPIDLTLPAEQPRRTIYLPLISSGINNRRRNRLRLPGMCLRGEKIERR